MVVIHHIPQYLVGRIPNVISFENGAAGVDIFFAISGFVMYGTALQPNASWRKFLISRASRIIPLYWTCTLILGLSAIFLPSLFKTFSTDWSVIFRSILFLPNYNNEGQIRPLLQMGWTLHYEVFFYLTTGLILYLTRFNAALMASALLAILSVALSLASVQIEFTPLILLAPITIEFLLGALIAYVALNFEPLRSPRLSVTCLSITLLLAGAYLIMSQSPTGISWARFSYWGIGGALILFGSLLLETRISQNFFSFIRGRFFGDISYALYLTHGFSLSLGFKLSKILSLQSFYLIGAVMLSVSIILAGITHHLLEKRLNEKFKALLASVLHQK